MARNSEKAMAMLNRWHQMKHNIVVGVKGRRPRRTEDSDNIKECEYWRHQIIREITQKISEIQNAALGETRLRDLNDNINNLLNEKQRWETRIKDLGGPDYSVTSARLSDALGEELVSTSTSGYKYFGAAKNLPGVREFFEKDSSSTTERRTRAQIYRNITPDYYGWRDEEDSELLALEKKREEELQVELMQAWRDNNQLKST
ncbi:pre-mRNA-splicing factor ISY1 homolog [Hylaeus volcanicus]|uniref:pre-mRNA-splicing factor ISY1 homolog n=1 Tax=Hylaeus volcanicus TaxID=313075 RepID=UPI0023B7CCD9|nr:pre-mRNA-splicing factor ISY1 homolog [Hylaeus volcanicus]